MAARVVPTRPDLDQYRKQSKDLLKRYAEGAADALARVRLHHPRLSRDANADLQRAVFKLADAQSVVAREHGFESWPKFSAHIRQVSAAALSDSFRARIAADQFELEVEAAGCTDAIGIVQFVAAGNVNRHDPGIRQIAQQLNRASFCTVLADVLTEIEESQDAGAAALQFDIRLLARRALAVTTWIRGQQRFANLPIGYLGFSTGAAASVIAATEHGSPIKAIVSSAGRPDLAGPWVGRLQVPMLAVVGGDDAVGHGFTRSVMTVIPRQIVRQLVLIDGAAQPFQAGSVSERAAVHARDWFSQHLGGEHGSSM